jgi:hypothetical protein
MAFSAPRTLSRLSPTALVGEADHDEGGEPRPDLDLHIDGTRLDALKGDGGNPREHRLKPPFRLSLQARVQL